MSRRIVGIGVDVVDLARFATTLERTPAMRQRLFTRAESALPVESLAGRFAAKEAFVKAVRMPTGLSWTDLEIITDAAGAPSFAFSETARDRVDAVGVGTVHVSISHDTTVATAFVVAEGTVS